MGFYSLYKIIKDVVRSIFGNKAWRYTLIIALIVIVFTLYSTKVNAEEVHDYVVDYYTIWNYTSGTSTHQLIFIPVFANSSYSVSWASGNNVVFSFIDSLSRVDNSQSVPMSTIGSNDQGSFGYFATKDGYLVLDHYSTDFTHPTYSITTDYDYSSNLHTIHQDLISVTELLKSLVGVEGEGVNADFITINGLCASISGKFVSSPNFSTIYFPVKNGFNYSVGFDNTDNRYDLIRCGYVSTIPDVDVTFSNVQTWNNFNYSNPIEFTSNANTYYFISYYNQLASNFKVSNNQNLLTDINNQSQQTRDTLTDSNISQNSIDYTLPSDSTNDITQDGFGSIFDRIRATFTSGSATPVNINIPFTNRSFTISKQSVFGSANLGIVGTLISSFWWFVVSLFIVKDIFKKIEAIKSGNIEFAETTNIKEDIL